MASKKISQLSTSTNPPLSGVTAVVHDGTTYKSTLSTLRQTLVDSGSHSFTGSQTINGDLTITGKIPSLIIGTGSFQSGQDIQPEILHVQNSGSYNIAYFQANNPYYAQINIKNTNSGSFASTDLVLTANNGSEAIHYVDLGINSSGYGGSAVGWENDSYLINSGKDIYIGTLGGSQHPAEVKLFTMGNWQTPHITLHTGTTVSFNTGSVSSGYTYEFNGDVKIVDRINTTTLLSDGNLNLSTDGDTVYVLGSNFVVENGGITANYDLVAQANVYISGITNLGSTSETIIPLNDPTTGYTHDFTSGAILYVTGATSDITIDVVNVPTSNNKGIGLTVMIEQGGTAYMIDSLKINTDDEGPVTIIWSGGSLPAGNPNSYDIVSFSILKINGTWKVFGQLTTF